MDSGNILSILANLAPPPGANAPDVQLPGVQNNVLQAAAAPPQAPQAPPTSTADIYHAATAASPPAPKPRRSLLDTIGRISDVIAQVGGAAPLYQPTLDAATKRATDAQDHGLLVDKTTIGNATDKFKLGDLQNARVSQFARGLKAIQAAGGDINQAMPILGQRMGLDPQTLQAMQSQVANDPHAIDGWIAAGLDPTKVDQARYGGQPVIATGPDGKLHAFQASLDGDNARDILPAGYTPVDPLQFVNQGGQQTGFGKNSGAPKIVLPNTETPGKAEDRQTQRDIATGHDKTDLTIAGMPARPTAATAKAGDPYTGYTNGVAAMRSLDASLGDLTGDPRLNEATGLVAGRLNVTAGQRAIKGKIASLVGQGIPAAIAAIKASGGAAPRSVAEIMGEVNGLVGAIENRDMATPDYIATINAARNRLRQRINEMSAEAVRQGFAVRDGKGNIIPAPKKSTPASGWGTATVVNK